MKFSTALKHLRKANGLTQEQLAKKCNIAQKSISNWESGNSYPGYRHLKKLMIELPEIKKHI